MIAFNVRHSIIDSCNKWYDGVGHDEKKLTVEEQLICPER